MQFILLKIDNTIQNLFALFTITVVFANFNLIEN